MLLYEPHNTLGCEIRVLAARQTKQKELKKTS